MFHGADSQRAGVKITFRTLSGWRADISRRLLNFFHTYHVTFCFLVKLQHQGIEVLFVPALLHTSRAATRNLDTRNPSILFNQGKLPPQKELQTFSECPLPPCSMTYIEKHVDLKISEIKEII